MGGILDARTKPDARPRFVVAASADPGTTSTPGHPLQRIQIIKGWVGHDGSFHQAVIDVAGNADNGATVDPMSCESEGEGFATLWSGRTPNSIQSKMLSITPEQSKIPAAVGLCECVCHFRKTSAPMGAPTHVSQK